MKKIFLILLIMLTGIKAFALEVVYPQKTMTVISSDSTFFIGSSNPNLPLTVNGRPVKVHRTGAFAQTVRLNNGKNIFNLESGEEKLIYIIDRPLPLLNLQNQQSCLKEYSAPVSAFTAKDGAVLRQTPVDSGINRLAHFQKDIPLIIDGENGDFLRTALNSTTKAWIYKGDVQTAGNSAPAALKNYERQDNAEFYIFNFDFDKKTPYIIQEGNPLKVTFYNTAGNPDLTYVFEFPLTRKLNGYSGRFEGSGFVLKIRKYPASLSGLKIAVDAGHGGDEFGAAGCLGDLEKNINLAVSKYLEEELTKRGASVIMTRTGDTDLGLQERVLIANENDAGILLSIHANSLPDNADPNANRGTSIYYYYNQAKPLADSILSSMTQKLGTRDDGVRQGSFALVRNTDALSVLIEVAYMINPYDNELLRDRNFQKQCAKAIADGIENYIKSE